MATSLNDLGSLTPSEERRKLIKSGIDHLDLWLSDLIRVGLLQYDFSRESMQEIASRMVDAKLGGIARRLRRIATLARSDPQWFKKVLDELAFIYLLVTSFKKIDQLPKSLQHTIYSVSGYSLQKRQLAALDGVHDEWMVMGLQFEEEENLRARYCWMMGCRSKRSALILDFAFGRSGFDTQISFHQSYSAKLVYYPSSFPIRGFLIDAVTRPKPNFFPGAFDHFSKFLDAYAYAVSKNPFLFTFPACIRNVLLKVRGQSFELHDINGKSLPVSTAPDKLWPLLATQGSDPISVFGTWRGETMEILSAVATGHHIQI